MVETHPLQVAVSFLLILSAIVIMLSAYQITAESVPEAEFLGEYVYVGGKKVRIAELVVEEVSKRLRGPIKALTLLMVRHAKEYLSYNAWGAAVLEATRAYRLLKKLGRTTS